MGKSRSPAIWLRSVLTRLARWSSTWTPRETPPTHLLGDATEDVADTLAGLFEQTLSFKFSPKRPPSLARYALCQPVNHAVSPDPGRASGQSWNPATRFSSYATRWTNFAGDYDAVFIDTPSPQLLYLLGLIATRLCLIPSTATTFHVVLCILMENVQEIRADHNRDLEVEGIVGTSSSLRQPAPEAGPGADCRRAADLQDHLSSSIKIRESHEQARPMIHLDPKHKLAQSSWPCTRNCASPDQ